MATSWTIKYAPQNTKEICSQNKAIETLKEFIINYKNQAKKAALLYGPTGTGKTSSVYAIANELNSEIIEVNDYKVFYFTPEKSGTYYLKVESKEDKESDSEWMYYYGFQQTKK